MTDISKGLFIVFEGIDLSGKSTQASYLHQWFQERGQNAILTYEPTGEILGRILRMSLQSRINLTFADHKLAEELSRAYLFAIDRYLHLKNEIEPNLKKGTHVICDRYYLSSLAYQSVELKRLGYDLVDSLERVKSLNLDALYSDIQPDLIIMMDSPVKAWEARKRNRLGANGVEEIYEEKAKREELLTSYDRAIKMFSEDERLRDIRLERINFEQFSGREQVSQEVIRLVKTLRSFEVEAPPIDALPLFRKLNGK